jgi:hypothetical protein
LKQNFLRRSLGESIGKSDQGFFKGSGHAAFSAPISSILREALPDGP